VIAWLLMRAALLVLVLGCGRIGIDPVESLAGDAPVTDAPRGCPDDMVAIADGVPTCVEKTERGTLTWTTAKQACTDAGRRLCAGNEWTLACKLAPGLVDMANDGGGSEINWEWVAEVNGDIADKRGLEQCTDMSAHEIFADPYDFRCCLDI